MWISTEDARSDFILAAAAVVFGTMVFSFVSTFPGYPRSGLIAAILLLGWMAVTSVLPARFLARNRGQGLEAFGLTGDRSGLSDAVLLSAPLLIVGYLQGIADGGFVSALLGRVRGVILSPSMTQVGLLDGGFNLAMMVLLVLGGITTYGLLVVRARDAFRATDIPLLLGLRTFGVGAVGVSALLGLLTSVGSSGRLWVRLSEAAALLAMVLITDRLVATSDRTTRATILAPAIVVAVIWIVASSGPLMVQLYRGATSAVLAIIVAVLIETRRSSWAVVPVIIASVWAPTCSVLPVGALISAGAPGC